MRIGERFFLLIFMKNMVQVINSLKKGQHCKKDSRSMLFSINEAMQQSHVMYHVYNQHQILVFVWHCKFTDILHLRECVKNPAFERNENHTIKIISWHKTQREANLEFDKIVKSWGINWPILNYTNYSNNHKNRIRCNQTGEIFYTHAEACRRHNLNASQLSQHLRRNPGFKSIKGLTFDYASYKTGKFDSVHLPAEKTEPYVVKQGKKIRCNETGQEFKTQGFACKWLKISASQLSNHLHGKTGFKTVKGLTFSYVTNELPQPYPIKYPTF